MYHIAAKFVPRLLTDDQKQNRVNVSQELLDRANGDDNIWKTLLQEMRQGCTGTMSKRKSNHHSGCQKKSPRPKKARQVRVTVKVMLTVFFDSEAVVHYEFLPQGLTDNKEYYLEVI